VKNIIRDISLGFTIFTLTFAILTAMSRAFFWAPPSVTETLNRLAAAAGLTGISGAWVSWHWRQRGMMGLSWRIGVAAAVLSLWESLYFQYVAPALAANTGAMFHVASVPAGGLVMEIFPPALFAAISWSLCSPRGRLTVFGGVFATVILATAATITVMQPLVARGEAEKSVMAAPFISAHSAGAHVDPRSRALAYVLIGSLGGAPFAARGSSYPKPLDDT
jgi:hypothetical protein